MPPGVSVQLPIGALLPFLQLHANLPNAAPPVAPIAPVLRGVPQAEPEQGQQADQQPAPLVQQVPPVVGVGAAGQAPNDETAAQPHADEAQPVDADMAARLAKITPEYKPLFPYPSLTKVQNLAFDDLISDSKRNLILAAPTGTGKTDAICIAAIGMLQRNPRSRMLIMVPTRQLGQQTAQLISQRLSQCQGLHSVCAVIDSESSQAAKDVMKNASVIVTNPEKWQHITASLADAELNEWICMFDQLIFDEVHLIGERERGPATEHVVFRMKHLNPPMRVIALSATIPNPEDIATWLGHDLSLDDARVAKHLAFNDEYRATPLLKMVWPVYISPADDLSWYKRHQRIIKAVPQVLLTQPVRRDPQGGVLILVSRKADFERYMDRLVEGLQEDEVKNGRPMFRRPEPAELILIQDELLKTSLLKGFGIHHADLPKGDKSQVIRLFEEKKIELMLCTTTLTTGINLGLRLVILPDPVDWVLTRRADKTVSTPEPMSLLRLNQAAGRAGRLGHAKEGTVVLLCPEDQRRHYEDSFVLGNTALEPLISGVNGSIARALLSEVVHNYVKTQSDLEKAFARFFWGSTVKTYGAKKRPQQNPQALTLANFAADEDLDALSGVKIVPEGMADNLYNARAGATLVSATLSRGRWIKAAKDGNNVRLMPTSRAKLLIKHKVALKASNLYLTGPELAATPTVEAMHTKIKAAMMRWVQAMPISEDQQAETSAMWGRPGFASNLEPMHQHDCMSYGRYLAELASLYCRPHEAAVKQLVDLVNEYGCAEGVAGKCYDCNVAGGPEDMSIEAD